MLNHAVKEKLKKLKEEKLNKLDNFDIALKLNKIAEKLNIKTDVDMEFDTVYFIINTDEFHASFRVFDEYHISFLYENYNSENRLYERELTFKEAVSILENIFNFHKSFKYKVEL